MSFVYCECIKKIMINARENVGTSFITMFLDNEYEYIYFYQVYEGFYNYIVVKRRYSQLSDFIFILL